MSAQPEKQPNLTVPRWLDADFVAACAPELPQTSAEAIAVFLYSGVTEIVSYDGYPDVQYSVAEELATQYFPAAFETQASQLEIAKPLPGGNARHIARVNPVRHIARVNHIMR